MAAQGAFATPYAEVGDAGDSLGGAQAIPAGTTSITGSASGGDVDMYSFIWGGGAITLDTFGSSFDTQLWLFDSAGIGVLSNDDHAGAACPGVATSGLQSCLDLSAGLAAGTYYVGITNFNNDPNNSTCGVSDQCTTFDLLAGWGTSAAPGTSAYVINLTASATPAPEPGIVLLLGLGLAGLGFARRR